MEIDRGKGQVARINDEDAELVVGFKWYPLKAEGKIYAAGWKHMPPGRYFVHLHRLIANAQPDEIIDPVESIPPVCGHRKTQAVGGRRTQSSLRIVPIPCSMSIRALVALLRLTRKDSSPPSSYLRSPRW